MFSIRLKELREKAGFSQAQLALKLGVRQSTVGMWENGKNKPQNAKLEMLATIFDVSIDYLLGRTDDPNGKLVDNAEPLEGIDFALSREIRDLSEEEKRDILDYVKFKKAQKSRQ